ncbi:MAG: hypothetical protein A4E65_03585 [Syntrophorhabdus sp. PtaU1.Bin153]|nr:MAG: hypothetical protein A4E65_03585 [Syntrophorhabdus sp. PtaU1.Bin153]
MIIAHIDKHLRGGENNRSMIERCSSLFSAPTLRVVSLYSALLPFNGLLHKYSTRRNTVSLTASLRCLPTMRSKFTRFRKLGRLYPASDMRITLRAVPSRVSGFQTCSKARLAKSPSCSLFRFYIFLGQQPVGFRIRHGNRPDCSPTAVTLRGINQSRAPGTMPGHPRPPSMPLGQGLSQLMGITVKGCGL